MPADGARIDAVLCRGTLETVLGTDVSLSGPPPSAPFELSDGNEHLFGAPGSTLSAPVQAKEGRLVIGGIFSVPGLGELTLKFPGRKGSAAVVS